MDSYPNAPGYIDRDTSRKAAESMAPITSQLAALVLASITHKPQTCDELEAGLQLGHQTASARITELRIAGRIEDSGERRPTRSGRTAKVWRVKRDAG